jgi:signal transduction histidine kinase
VVSLAAKSGRGFSDVSISFTGDERAQVCADPSQLRQLLWNLVRNAVQASNAGGTVEVAITDSNGDVVLTVQDDGVGIDPVAKERLFDAFFTTRSHGTGIGLAVVKRIADEHGFAIDVASAQGSGALFRVNLGPRLAWDSDRPPPPVAMPPNSVPPPA